MYKFKRGDEVLVVAGRDKGKSGKVSKVLISENKLVVEGVNLYKRHRKVSKGKPAGIYEVMRPVPVANLVLVCPKCGKRTRVGFGLEGEVKIRICRKCKSAIDSG